MKHRRAYRQNTYTQTKNQKHHKNFKKTPLRWYIALIVPHFLTQWTTITANKTVNKMWVFYIYRKGRERGGNTKQIFQNRKTLQKLMISMNESNYKLEINRKLLARKELINTFKNCLLTSHIIICVLLYYMCFDTWRPVLEDTQLNLNQKCKCKQQNIWDGEKISNAEDTTEENNRLNGQIQH